MDRRATCLNCMDGRVQSPVLAWIKHNYAVDFVDVITEAGMDGVLANHEDISVVLRSIGVSVNLNKSTRVFIVGHYDCRGNAVEEAVHKKDIARSVSRLKKHLPKLKITGLWVDDSWSVRELPAVKNI